MQYQRYGKILNRTKFDPNEIISESDMAKIVLYNKNGDKIAEALIDAEKLYFKEFKSKVLNNEVN